MEQVCPLCNGLTNVSLKCKNCGATMTDAGLKSDYDGPYAPYEVDLQFKQGVEGPCTHLLHCFTCGNETYAIIRCDFI